MLRAGINWFLSTGVFVFVLVGQALAQTASNCKETDPNQFFALINAPVQSYIAPLDRNGSNLLSENEIFIQKSRHYFAEFKDFPPVTISMERFASVTENNPTALENFESKITVLGPNCNRLNMYRSRLVGSFSAPFEEIMELVELGLRTENEAIIQFSTTQLTPQEIEFEKLIAILSNDLALDENVVNAMISESLRGQFLPQGGKINLNSMSEMALLGFSSMGGLVDSKVGQIYVFIPKSVNGINNMQETAVLTSDARLYNIAGFDHGIASKVLSRLGVRTTVVQISEIATEKFGNCKIDLAGKWMQVVRGKKVRSCPFMELVQVMLNEKSYIGTFDYKFQAVVFDEITKILESKNM